jgi:hypothetical protein
MTSRLAAILNGLTLAALFLMDIVMRSIGVETRHTRCAKELLGY